MNENRSYSCVLLFKNAERDTLKEEQIVKF